MKVLVWFTLLLVPSLSFAKEVPKPSPFDSRIQSVDYQKSEVVSISVHAASAVRIVFSKEEQIVDVASGFTEGWELLDRGNILYLKARSLTGKEGALMSPTPQKWNTNLMVTTNLRLYDFELKLVPSAKRAAFRVEFRYPAYEAKQKQILQKKQASQKLLQKKYAPKNWYYSMQVGKRSKSIVPTVAYDDGNFTYLRFPNNREFPAVFLVDESGNESLVNRHVEGDMLVVHRVTKKLVLRAGKKVVGIFNEGFDKDGVSPKDKTTSPGLKRVRKGGK